MIFQRRCRSLLVATLVALTATALPALAEPQGRATGSYVYRGSSGGATELAIVSGGGWNARAIEATVRPLAGAAGSIGLVLHQQNASNHYLFLVSTNSTALMIYRNLGGNYTLLGSTPHLPLSAMAGNEYVLRGEDDGAGNLTIFWDGVPKLTVQDSTFTSGDAGLRTWAMTADFDDVRVEDGQSTTLLFDDFEDGDASGWSASSAWSVVSSTGGATMPIPVFETGFEGGNGELGFVDPFSWSIYVTPELKGSSPYRAWFYFKLSNLSSQQPTNLVFQSVSFFTRPWYSYDNQNWTAFPTGSGGTYSTTFAQDEVWIAHSIPYLTRHKDDLIADLSGPRVRVSTLATSEGGRPVEVLEITARSSYLGKQSVWFLARQHAWEASGSWMADGLARWLVSSDPAARALLLKARVFVIPIMDIDNVVIGGSGKDQVPIDINRDWRDAPHWNVVRGAIDRIAADAERRPYAVFIDSHCPGSSTSFLGVQPQSMVPESYWQRFHGFRQLFTQAAVGSSHPYTGSYQQWGPSYHPLWYQMSFWHQFAAHPGLRLSLTLETAVGSNQGYADLSAAFGRALEAFLPWPWPLEIGPGPH